MSQLLQNFTTSAKTRSISSKLLSLVFVLFLSISSFAASVTFNTVYKGTGNSFVLESSSITNVQAFAYSSFQFTSAIAGANFSGNNVNGTFTYNNGVTTVTVYGTVSRLFKQGNAVQGFYFVSTTDATYNTLTGEAYIFVSPGYESAFAVGQNYGTSSDPVDAKLNALQATQNSGAPIAGSATADQLVCLNATPAALTLTGYTNGATIQWQANSIDPNAANGSWSNVSGTGVTTATLPAATMGAVTGTKYYRAAVTNNSVTSYSNTVTVSVNNALDFDGSNDYVLINDPVFTNGQTDFTMEAWINPTSANWNGQYHGFIGAQTDNVAGGRSPSLWLYDGKIHLDSYSDTQTPVRYDNLTTSAVVTANTWNHIAWVKEATTYRLYVNGNLVLTYTAPTGVKIYQNFYWIGRVDNYFAGKIDNVNFWSVPRTQAQIQSDLTGDLTGSETGLIATYNFNQGIPAGSNSSITSLFDDGPSSLNGTLTNIAKTGSTSNFVSSTPLAISTQPASSSSVCVGSSATPLTVSALGFGALSYQWYSNTSNINTGGTLISGATNSTYTPPSTTAGTYYYYVVVTGACSATITSNAATVTVNALPSFLGNAINFDGVNDVANAADNNTLDITNAITLEAWVYPTKNSGIQNVISKSSTSPNDSYIFPRTDNGWTDFVLYLYVGGTWRTLSYNYPALNTWHHLAATYDGTTAKLYLDGTLVNSASWSGTIATNTNPLAIGNQTGFSEYFGGSADELRVWNVARTQAQIQASMNNNLVGNETGLVAYYRADQGTAAGNNTSITTLTDSGPNGFNATLSGFALTGATSNFVAGKVASTSNTGSSNVCVGSTTTLTNSVSGGVWSSSNTSVATVNSSTGVVTGVSVGSVVITYTVTNGSGCTNSATTNMTVGAAQSAGTISGTASVCTSGTTTLSTTGTGGTWSSSNTGIATVNSSTGVVTGVAAGSANIVYTVASTAGCSAATATQAVTVTTPPGLSSATTATVCSGSAFAYTPTSSSAGSTFSWTRAVVAGISNTAGSGTGAISETLVNTTNASVNVTYVYTVTNSNGCSTTQNVVVTVYTTPTVNAIANQTLCHGAATTAVTFGGSAGATYSWTNSATSIGLAASGSGAGIPSFTAVNTGSSAVTATVSVTATYNNTSNLDYTVYSTHGGNGSTSQYPGTPSNVTDLNSLFNTANSNTVVTSTGTATASSLLNWTSYTNLTSAGISIPNSGNYFAVKVTGTFVPAETGTYTFAVDGDDAVDVSIGGTVVCSYYGGHPFGGWHTGTINLVAGTSYSFVARHQEFGGGEGIAVAWKRPSQSTYTLQPSEFGTACQSSVRTFTITVNPGVLIDQVANQVIASGTSTTAVNFSSNNNNATYDWTNDNTSVLPFAAASGNLAAFTGTNTGTAPIVSTISVTGSVVGGCSSPAPMVFTITVNPKPTMVQPSNVTLNNGSPSTPINFTTNNTGGTTTYAWTNNNTAIGLGASGSGATIPSFTPTNTGTAPITATITVTPTYTSGGVSANGTPVTFTITVNPTAQVNAVANQVLSNGQSTTAVTFATVNTGGTTTYAWTNSTTSIGLAASGSGNIASFTAVNTGTAPVVATITVTPTFTNGVSNSGTPITFTITVNPTPQVNAVTSQTVAAGTSTTAINFTTNNTGGTTTYAWTNNNTAIGLGASGTGSSIPAFTATNTGTAPITATITVTPTYTNGGVSTQGTPITFTITVNPVAQVTQPLNQVLSNGQSTAAVTFATVNTGGTTTYAWTNNTTSIGLAASGAGNIAAFTAINTGTTPVVATITVTPTYSNAGLSADGPSKTFTITVNPTPQMNQPASQVVSNGQSTAAVNFTTNNTGGTTTYAWTNNTTSIGLAASGSGNITSFSAVNTGTAPVVATITVTPTYTNGGVSTVGSPLTFTITVNPTGQVNTVANQVLNHGQTTTAVNFTTANTGGTTTYAWTNNTTSIGLAASGTGSTIAAFTAINTTNAPVVATITVTPTYSNGGLTVAGTPRTFTITVNPIPTVNAVANQVVCNGSQQASVAFSGAVAGTVFNWTNSTTSIGLAASGTGNLPAFTAVNTGTTPVVATITVTPTFTNGGVTATGTATTFTITVNPTPIVSAGTLPSRICISDTLIQLNGTPTGGSWSGIGVGSPGFIFIPRQAAIGSYTLTYTFNNMYACSASASIVAKVEACTERDRTLALDAVSLYPNPTNGNFTLKVNSSLYDKLEMRMYKANGQYLGTKQFSVVYGRTIPVDLTYLPNGVYFIKLTYDDGNNGATKVIRIIIQH